jgi:hypothetical protein
MESGVALKGRSDSLIRAHPNGRKRREGVTRPAAAQGQLATQLARRRCLNRSGIEITRLLVHQRQAFIFFLEGTGGAPG